MTRPACAFGLWVQRGGSCQASMRPPPSLAWPVGARRFVLQDMPTAGHCTPAGVQWPAGLWVQTPALGPRAGMPSGAQAMPCSGSNMLGPFGHCGLGRRITAAPPPAGAGQSIGAASACSPSGSPAAGHAFEGTARGCHAKLARPSPPAQCVLGTASANHCANAVGEYAPPEPAVFAGPCLRPLRSAPRPKGG